MRVIVAGGGTVGVQLAARLVGAGHEVTVVEVDPDAAAGVPAACRAAGGARCSPRVVAGSACVVEVLEAAGALSADALVACTGDDAENLVIAALAKRHLDVPRVVARCDALEHEWLFDARWGVDVAVSYASALAGALASEGPSLPVAPSP